MLLWTASFDHKLVAMKDAMMEVTRDNICRWSRLLQSFTFLVTRKCPLRGHILAPPEGLRAPEVPGVNPGGRPQESGSDSKAI